jgi:autoinducer 2-degrading protein
VNEFVLIVEFQVKPECLEKFNQAIAINAKASVREEPGCRQFDVLASEDDPNHVVLYEVYESEAAFRDDHMKRAHTQTFLAQAKELVTKQTAYRLKRTVAPPVKQ